MPILMETYVVQAKKEILLQTRISEGNDSLVMNLLKKSINQNAN